MLRTPLAAGWWCAGRRLVSPCSLRVMPRRARSDGYVRGTPGDVSHKLGRKTTKQELEELELMESQGEFRTSELEQLAAVAERRRSASSDMASQLGSQHTPENWHKQRAHAEREVFERAAHHEQGSSIAGTAQNQGAEEDSSTSSSQEAQELGTEPSTSRTLPPSANQDSAALRDMLLRMRYFDGDAAAAKQERDEATSSSSSNSNSNSFRGGSPLPAQGHGTGPQQRGGADLAKLTHQKRVQQREDDETQAWGALDPSLSSEGQLQQLSQRLRQFWGTGNVEHAVGCFEDARSQVTPELAQWGQMLAGFAKTGNVEQMNKYFKRMQASGVKPDIQAYNTIISGYVKSGQPAMARRLFDNVQASALQPDTVTYGVYMSILAQQGDAESMRDIIALMKERGVRPDLVIFNQLLTKLEQQQDDAGVLQVFKQLQSYNLKPDSFTYLTLFKLLARRGNIAAIEDMYRQMKKAGVRPNRFVFNVIFKACAALNDIDTMMTFFKRLKRPDRMSYNSVLQALGEVQPPPTERMQGLVMRMKIDDIYPDTTTYTLLMKASAAAGREDTLEGYFREMCSNHRLRPGVDAYNCLMQHYSQAGDTERMLEYLESMKNAGVRANMRTHLCLISHFGRLAEGGQPQCTDAMMMYFAELPKPSLAIYQAVLRHLSAVAEGGNEGYSSTEATHALGELRRVFNQLQQEEHLTVDAATAQALLQGAERRGCEEDVLIFRSSLGGQKM